MMLFNRLRVSGSTGQIFHDYTPDNFSFNPVSGATLSTWYSTSAVVTGIDDSTMVTVTSPGYISLDGSTWTQGTLYINSGQTLYVGLTSSASGQTATTVTVTVGTMGRDWTVTTFLAPNWVRTYHVWNNTSTYDPVNARFDATVVSGSENWCDWAHPVPADGNWWGFYSWGHGTINIGFTPVPSSPSTANSYWRAVTGWPGEVHFRGRCVGNVWTFQGNTGNGWTSAGGITGATVYPFIVIVSSGYYYMGSSSGSYNSVFYP